MRKEVFVCDHCGKEFDYSNGSCGLDSGSFNSDCYYDLCDECQKELEEIIKKFCPSATNPNLVF